jgi:hypothetical protein
MKSATNSFRLRDYQIAGVMDGVRILENNNLLILNYEVRCGKTHIALKIADDFKSKTFFVTKKKAIGSILSDHEAAGYGLDIEVINYEQLHKYKPIYDLVILDESHSMGAFPKPSLRTKEARRICAGAKYVILMSGTLMPESNSQIFHQLWATGKSPFNHANFYKWFHDFGTPKIKYTSYGECNDYSCVDFEKIKPYLDPIILTKTQSEAGFVSTINERFLKVKMKDSTYELIKRLKKDKVIEGKSGVLLADTQVKEMQKIHQLYSGTVKLENGVRASIDSSKAVAIRSKFAGMKKAIFYKFIAELELIKQHLDVTDNIEEFNNSTKDIALQIVSGREGINLSKADVLIYYNIDFSAVSYWQSRDRLSTIDRKQSDVYWVFADGGIEWQIYNAVSNKKDFTLQTFRSWQANTRLK